MSRAFTAGVQVGWTSTPCLAAAPAFAISREGEGFNFRQPYGARYGPQLTQDSICMANTRDWTFQQAGAISPTMA
jgi:hypothetical protein